MNEQHPITIKLPLEQWHVVIQHLRCGIYDEVVRALAEIHAQLAPQRAIILAAQGWTPEQISGVTALSVAAIQRLLSSGPGELPGETTAGVVSRAAVAIRSMFRRRPSYG